MGNTGLQKKYLQRCRHFDVTDRTIDCGLLRTLAGRCQRCTWLAY